MSVLIVVGFCRLYCGMTKGSETSFFIYWKNISAFCKWLNFPLDMVNFITSTVKVEYLYMNLL
jgi:hypothetical protein